MGWVGWLDVIQGLCFITKRKITDYAFVFSEGFIYALRTWVHPCCMLGLVILRFHFFTLHVYTYCSIVAGAPKVLELA